MNNGTAIYQGERIYFSDCILNQWTNEAEYLIIYNSEVFWVKQQQLSDIRYNVVRLGK